MRVFASFVPSSGMTWRRMFDSSAFQLWDFLFGFSAGPSARYSSASSRTVNAARASALASIGSRPAAISRSRSRALVRASSQVHGEPCLPIVYRRVRGPIRYFST